MNKKKIEAIKLRRKGLSYGEIKKKINTPKSTLSSWLKTIPLTPRQRKRLYTKKISNLSKGPQGQRERRKREINQILKEAKKEIPLPLSFETIRFFGAGLYWAEGTKNGRFEITNSDPYLILFMVKWIKKVLNVSSSQLKAKLNIYPQQNDKKIKQFWSQLTGIPLKNFTKSFIKPLSKNYKKNNLYYGTMKITIPKGTDLRYRTFGWVDVALKDISPGVELAEEHWVSLKETPRPINLPR